MGITKPLALLMLLMAAMFVAGCPQSKPSAATTPSAEPATATDKPGAGDKSGSTDKSGAPKEDDEGGW